MAVIIEPTITGNPGLDALSHIQVFSMPFMHELFAQFISVSSNGLAFNAQFVFMLELISIAASLILGTLLLIVIWKMHTLDITRPVEMAATTIPAARALYDDQWTQVKAYANSLSESEWKLAIIEADKIMDDALKLAGVVGENMGERLMHIQPGQLPSLQQVWDAHKTRNLLVHDINAHIDQAQAQSAVVNFERGLRDLGALS